MNLTFQANEPLNPQAFMPTQQCADWCIGQKVIGYNNLELQAAMVAASALLFIIAGEWLKEYPHMEKYAPFMFYMAKITLYFFFFIYFFYVKGGV